MQDVAFVGIDQFTPPARLSPGWLQQADNCLIEQTDIVSRPGIQGVLASAVTGGAIYCPTPFVKTSGVDVLFVSASGKLYKWTKGNTTVSEVLTSGSASFAFSAPANVRSARYGKYLYFCDGVGALVRYDGTNGETVTSLTAPTSYTPSVTLTSSPLEPASGGTVNASDWVGISNFSTAEMLSNGSFETNSDPGSVGYPTAYTSWTSTGEVAGYTSGGVVTPQDGSWCTQYDKPGDSLEQIVAARTTTAIYAGDSATPGTVACRVYKAHLFVLSLDSGANNSVVVTITARDSGSNIIAQKPFVLTPAYAGAPDRWTEYTLIASFTDLPADPANIGIKIAAGDNNNPTAAGSIWVDNVSLKAVSVRPSTSAVQGSTTALHLGVTATASATTNDVFSAAGFAIGGMVVARTFSSTQNWSSANGVGVIALGLNLPPAFLTADGVVPRIRLGIQGSGAGKTVEWTQPVTVDAARGFAYVDITVLSATTRAAVKYAYLQVLDDLKEGVPPSILFDFGPITNSGRLSVSLDGNSFAPYSYIFSERYLTGAGDYILSSGSQYSIDVTPDGRYAQVVVDLDASSPGNLPVNNGSGGTVTAQYFDIWRRGGTFGDSYARLIATVSTTSTTATGPGASFVTWDNTTRQLTDNCPDSALEFAAIYEVNRDNFPTGIQTLHVAEGEGRFYATKGATVYVSWLLNLTSGESGLYTSFVSLPTSLDKNSDLKGARFDVSSTADADTIKAIVSLGTPRISGGGDGAISVSAAKIIYRTNGISILEGSTPSTFDLKPVAGAYGLGTTSGLSCIVDADGNTTSYTSASGIYQFDTDVPKIVSEVVQPYLAATGDDGGSTLSATALAGIVQIYHDRRRYTFLPVLGATTNTTCLVFDYRQGGYTRWTLPATVTGACTISFSGLPGSLILTGADGMLYAVQNETDKATSGASESAFTVTVKGRAMGQDDASVGQYQTLIPSWFWAETNCPITTTPTLSVTGVVTAAAWSQAWTVSTTGDYRISTRVAHRASGRNLTPQITLSVTRKWRLRSWMLTAAAGTDRQGT